MPLITPTHVMNHLDDVTPEDIGRCHEVIGPDHKTFYMVENEEEKYDEQNKLIEYKVTYDKKYGFQCTCDSGKIGFANVTNWSGVCKHVRWAVACALEKRKYLRQLAVRQAVEELAL